MTNPIKDYQEKQVTAITQQKIPSVFLHINDYMIRNGNKIITGLQKGSAKAYYKKFYGDDEEFNDHVTPLLNFDRAVDYFTPSRVHYDGDNVTVSVNPMDDFTESFLVNENIVSEFEEKIMDGKLDDFLKIIFYSMYFKESKKNKLVFIGKSDKGKTGIPIEIGFMLMTAKEFIKVLDGTGRFSKEQATRLQESGLLLADDISIKMPLGIKNISDEIIADVFHTGGTKLPVKFMVITSTHDGVLQGATDEIKNRLLKIDIGNGMTFPESTLWRQDSDEYKKHTRQHVQNKIKNIVNSCNCDKVSEFRELQEKYKLDDYNERDEIMETVFDKVSDLIKNEWLMNPIMNPSVLKKDGNIYLKGKRNFTQKIKGYLLEEYGEESVTFSGDLSKDVTEIWLQIVKTDKAELLRFNDEVAKVYLVTK